SNSECTLLYKSPKEIRPGAADLSRYASGSAGKSRAHFPVRPFALPPAALTLRFSPKSALAPTRRALNNAPRAQTRGSLFPILAAMLGGGYGDLSNHLRPVREGVFNTPYGAPEHRKALGVRPEGVVHRDVRDRSMRQEVSLDLRRAPKPRSAGQCAIRGRVSLVTFFARAKKVTLGAGREHPAFTQRRRRRLDIREAEHRG
ncbi:MAG: hypothetical protein WD823_04695, partial [Sulfuricaulis sp.]|uniref:hypothetical protein n=1 Tax=Sulfuricaulis sp. TaxID=2003553 RepID=UPI0034A1A620